MRETDIEAGTAQLREAHRQLGRLRDALNEIAQGSGDVVLPAIASGTTMDPRELAEGLLSGELVAVRVAVEGLQAAPEVDGQLVVRQDLAAGMVPVQGDFAPSVRQLAIERDALHVRVLELEARLHAAAPALAVLDQVLSLFVADPTGGWSRSVNVLAEDLDGWRATARKASGA